MDLFKRLLSNADKKKIDGKSFVITKIVNINKLLPNEECHRLKVNEKSTLVVYVLCLYFISVNICMFLQW